MTDTTLLQIAEDLASAAATLCCWVEDDCPGNEDPSQAECDEAVEKARAAIVDFDRWKYVQHGQREAHHAASE